MMLDANTKFSDDQAITATAASTNYMDLQAANTPPGGPATLGHKIGGALDIPLLIQVTTSFATLQVGRWVGMSIPLFATTVGGKSGRHMSTSLTIMGTDRPTPPHQH